MGAMELSDTSTWGQAGYIYYCDGNMAETYQDLDKLDAGVQSTAT